MNNIYLIDEAIVRTVFFQNSFYIVKLLIVSYFLFYWLPSKIFPQFNYNTLIEKIVANFVFMVVYVELTLASFIFLKIFSIPTFIISLFVTKLLFIKFYEKKNPFQVLNDVRIKIMIFAFDILDEPQEHLKKFNDKLKLRIIEFQKKITFYNVARYALYIFVFVYILSTLMMRGLESVADPIPDTGQFIDWVTHLEKNILYADRQPLADFYGISVLIFFVHTFTNIDPIILFSIYPVLLLLALYLSIYYVLEDFTKSSCIALFGVMVHGIFLMSPLADYVLGSIISTSTPQVMHFWHFSFYIPTKDEIDMASPFNFVTYQRYITGMAYEHSSVFVLLNAYFLIKALATKLNKYIILYTLSLLAVFTFHGGGAIVLVVISILIAFNSIIFRQLNVKLLKKGLLGVVVATILGNLWMLSVIKYGIPQDFGSAAPFLDQFFNTKANKMSIVKSGVDMVSYIHLNTFHLFLFVLLLINFIVFLFKKDRFTNISFLLIIVGIFIVFFGPTAGFPNLAAFTRLAEYYFFAVTLLLGISFGYIYRLLPRALILTIMYGIFIIAILVVPTWLNKTKNLKLINLVEWNSIPEFIVKINNNNRKFTWTFISYVSEYPKLKDKAYHINTNKFLMQYSPIDKYLEIPTDKIFIAVEDYKHHYMGLSEWYYRWRQEIENNLKAWIAIYATNHNNIKVLYRSKTVTLYEIDNSDYMKYKRKKERDARRE